MEKPGTGPGREAMGLAAALRGCLGAGIIYTNPTAGIATITPDAAELLRLLPTPVTGRQAWELLPERLRQLANEGLRGPFEYRQVEVPTRAGAVVVIEVSAVPVGGQEPGVILLLSDVNLLMQCEERLQRLDRLANLGTLAASMAHEIKNALVASKTFIDLLLEKNPEAELTDVARRELARIEAIVARLLKFARSNRAQFSELCIHDLLDHTLRLLQPQLENRGITLQRQLEAGSNRVNGDEGELLQAFMNLLLNALEAMAPDGLLTVRTDNVPSSPVSTSSGQQIRVSISDTGVGIPPAILPHLFDPFFTTKPLGTGLGLAVTKKIIEEHHGVLTVESVPGKGTSFHMVLPVAV